MAPGHGFEPRLDDPESPVLPLDDPGISFNNNFILALKIPRSIIFYKKSHKKKTLKASFLKWLLGWDSNLQPFG